MATLNGVKIEFSTHDDNKDDDTRLDVSVKDRKNIFLSQELAAAQDLAHNVEFVDPSVHEFDLPLSSQNVTLESLNIPVVEIGITPNGNDRWIFDYKTSLTFDDGNTFTAGQFGVILDQDNRHHVGLFTP